LTSLAYGQPRYRDGCSGVLHGGPRAGGPIDRGGHLNQDLQYQDTALRRRLNAVYWPVPPIGALFLAIFGLQTTVQPAICTFHVLLGSGAKLIYIILPWMAIRTTSAPLRARNGDGAEIPRYCLNRSNCHFFPTLPQLPWTHIPINHSDERKRAPPPPKI
jgi:hypothetical protein